MWPGFQAVTVDLIGKDLTRLARVEIIMPSRITNNDLFLLIEPVAKLIGADYRYTKGSTKPLLQIESSGDRPTLYYLRYKMPGSGSWDFPMGGGWSAREMWAYLNGILTIANFVKTWDTDKVKKELFHEQE